MSMTREFEALRKASKQQALEQWQRFLEKNVDILALMRTKGLLVEHTRERDHLYVTFGEHREGMAMFAGHIVVIADPETMECIGVEVPDFQKLVESGTLRGGWERLAPFIAWQRVIHIPPVDEDEVAVESDTSDLPHDLAHDLQRELVPA